MVLFTNTTTMKIYTILTTIVRVGVLSLPNYETPQFHNVYFV